MSDKNVLLVEEQALHEQEQGLVQMEAQLHAQEQGVAQMERSFQKKNKALLNHASYVKEQETNLLRRADLMGQRARQLASELLAGSNTQIGSMDFELGKLGERTALMQRRRELMSARMALMEEREALYAARTDVLERAEAMIGELEQKLVRRETAVTETARQIFSATSGLIEDDDDEGEPASHEPSYSVGATLPLQRTVDQAVPYGGRIPAQVAQGESSRTGNTSEMRAMSIARMPGEAPVKLDNGRETMPIGGDALQVASGQVDHPEEDEDDGIGGVSRAEDRATRKRASARARVRTNQFKITLEAHLDGGEPHHFFRYEHDGAGDLPGLFIATPNLLKVGREVRIRVGRQSQFLEATGIVAWRRQRGDAGGAPGMGIELLNLSDPERQLVSRWIKDKAPVTI